MPSNNSATTLSYAIIIPTYNGKQDLKRLFQSLSTQTLKAPIFVVDSSSTDGTYELAQEYTRHATQISSAEFNHGGTRQAMALQCEQDILIYMTQDAYLANPESLAEIVKPFTNNNIGAVCGRQLPHIDANPIAAHARLFNYPEQSLCKSAKDIPNLGVKAAFMSNSYSAYRRTALLEVGGFPDNVILSEDMYVAAKMLLKGWQIAYQGSAQCHHSHNYSLIEEARRYFDIGVFFAQQEWVKKELGSPQGEGMRFIKSEFRYLLSHAPIWIPNALIRNFLKLSFFELGKREKSLSINLKRKLSMHKRYWK